MKQSSRLRSTAKLSTSVEHQLNLYALSATAAGVGLLALAQPAEGRVVYTKTHKVIQGQRSRFPLNLDLNHDGIVDFQFRINSGTSGSWRELYVHPYASKNRVFETSGSGNGLWASAFVAGIRIGPKAVNDSGQASRVPQRKNRRLSIPPSVGSVGMEGWFCNTNSCPSHGPWLNVKNRYLGLVFVIKGKTHYGWARLSASIQNQNVVKATLSGYAYETIANKAIITGKTKGKEVTVRPASLGHLARGASAISATCTQ